MDLTYVKLNEYDYNKSSFPYCVCGVFSDGLNKHLIILPFKGEILFESNKGIPEADSDFKEKTGLKKMGDIVVSLVKMEQFI